jgi:hypothetical protein
VARGAQVKSAATQRTRLAAERAAAEERAAAAAARLPELDAEKKAAAAAKVRFEVQGCA